LLFLCSAQKQYSLELKFLTDSNEPAPNVNVNFIKRITEGCVLVKKIAAAASVF